MSLSNIERRDQGLVYISDDSVFEEQKIARRITQKLNTMDRSDFDSIRKTIRELFGKIGENSLVNPPFYCDYGTHIEIGKNFFANYNCTMLDVGMIRIGDNVQMAPNVAIYTAGHPVHPATRNTMYEYGIDVTIGDNVWVGGNVVICPGVTIGANSVIGAGSVVTKDIPEWCVAAGNPARVIRKITEEDRNRYFAGKEIDAEALEHIQRIQADENDPYKYPTA
jgi:acetyltransferase-like isoleucine patch superfamily enzyme